jgi:protein SCO1/2
MCPIMTARMSALQTSLDGVEGVRLVSISVDPNTDTPEKLREFADAYGARPDRWLFVKTDTEEQVRTLAAETFLLGVSDGSDPEEPIVHSSKFVLVDADGVIRGYYDAKDPEMDAGLLADVRTLLQEGR